METEDVRGILMRSFHQLGTQQPGTARVINVDVQHQVPRPNPPMHNVQSNYNRTMSRDSDVCTCATIAARSSHISQKALLCSIRTLLQHAHAGGSVLL
jgi:hypothetical protein